MIDLSLNESFFGIHAISEGFILTYSAPADRRTSVVKCAFGFPFLHIDYPPIIAAPSFVAGSCNGIPLNGGECRKLRLLLKNHPQ
jgi:hypothetical protein